MTDNSPSITTRSLRSREGKNPVYNFKKLNYSNNNNNDSKKGKKVDRPRWYNQTYLIFLVLREANGPLPRSELIRRTLLLDKQYSKEMGLPTCFHGKVYIRTLIVFIDIYLHFI